MGLRNEILLSRFFFKGDLNCLDPSSFSIPAPWFLYIYSVATKLVFVFIFIFENHTALKDTSPVTLCPPTNIFLSHIYPSINLVVSKSKRAPSTVSWYPPGSRPCALSCARPRKSRNRSRPCTSYHRRNEWSSTPRRRCFSPSRGAADSRFCPTQWGRRQRRFGHRWKS